MQKSTRPEGRRQQQRVRRSEYWTDQQSVGGSVVTFYVYIRDHVVHTSDIAFDSTKSDKLSMQ